MRAFGVVALLACHSAVPLPQVVEQGACRGPDDRTHSLIAELAGWMVTTDPEQIARRDTVFNIPVVNPNEITLVTDDAVCVRARNAYAAPGQGPVYVLRLATEHFAVLDPAFLAGSIETVKIFSKDWQIVGGWSGP
jgi:hypothetical protein